MRRVQSKRAAAPTSWTRRFARKSVNAAIAFSRSASRVIAAMRIAHRRVAWRHGAIQSALHVNATAPAPKGASIIATISGPIAPA
jgi:hypothetical protein